MDAASAALDELRGQGAFVLRCELEQPFLVRVEDGAAVGVVAPVRGALLLRAPDLPEVSVAPGEVAVVPRLATYDVIPVDGSGDERPVRILPGGHCADEHGADLSPVMWLDTRVWGTRLGGSHAFVTGSYESSEQLGGLVLSSLREIAVAPAPPQLLDLLTAELAGDQPGQSAVLDRLVDLLLASTLRAWFADPAHPAPVGWRAQQDPLVGQVLDLIHRSPGDPWTVALLADRVGWSRATVARRFSELVGEAPMTYLTRWRMLLAADRLRRTGLGVAEVGREVGYENAFAFSTAFKRAHGASPQAYRRSAVNRNGERGADLTHPVSAHVTEPLDQE